MRLNQNGFIIVMQSYWFFIQYLNQTSLLWSTVPIYCTVQVMELTWSAIQSGLGVISCKMRRTIMHLIGKGNSKWDLGSCLAPQSLLEIARPQRWIIQRCQLFINDSGHHSLVILSGGRHQINSGLEKPPLYQVKGTMDKSEWQVDAVSKTGGNHYN